MIIGDIATNLLSKVLELDGFAVHFLFDKWVSLSIKDCKRENRSAESGSILYEIKGASQKRPSNWLSALQSLNFKKPLMYFLIDFWSNDQLTYLFNSKIFYVDCNDRCYQYYASNNQVSSQEDQALYSTHEEAEETHTSNNIRYNNIDELYSQLGKSLCKSLPTYDVFTRSDYTPSFTRSGKVKPIKILEKLTEYQSAFIELTKDSEIKETSLQKIEEFLCVMYGKKKSTTVNDARLDMFPNKYKTKEDQRKNTTKTLDGSSILFSATRKNQTQRFYFKSLDVFIFATYTCVITNGLCMAA